MAYDAISSWVEKAKNEEIVIPQAGGIVLIKRVDPKNKGFAIMKIAEALFPWIMKMFEGDRDSNGMLLHPARARAVALNVAQRIVKEQETKAA